MLSLGGRYKEAMTNKTLRSFRVTTEDQTPVLDLLTMEGFRFEPEPFSESCFRLVEEPFPLGSSLAAHFGYVYIQDRSSMLPPLALSPQRGAAVLDMCASPGSKTGFLAQMVGKDGFVLGNELSHSRLYTLRMNLQTTNAVCAGTCSFSGDAIPLVESSWKNILLDPPCSGWGTVEKNPKVLEVWREDKVRPLIVLQRRLLARAAALLAPGGTVVYSTCTTNSEENEQQVAWAEAELGLVRDPIEPFAGFAWDDRAGSEGTLRVDGKKSQAQGFYIARLKKPGTSPDTDRMSGKSLPIPGEMSKSALHCATIDPELLPNGRIAVFSGIVRLLPAQSLELLPEGFVWQGFPLGRLGSGGFQAEPRLRAFMRDKEQALVLESVAEVRSLLSGASMKTGLSGKEAGLWLKDLPLGRVSLRNGRVIVGFGK